MSLIAWYPLNGNTNDYSGNGYDIQGGSPSVDNDGKIGKCYKFNNNYFTLPINCTVTQKFSISVWVYQTSTQNACIYNTRTVLGSGVSLFILSSQIRFDSGGQWLTGYTVPLNKWVHLTFVKDNNIKKLYVNGSLYGQTSCTDTIDLYTKSYIGASFINSESPGNYFIGKLNDIRIYDHVLSLKEIKEISKANILHYKFNDAMEEPTVNLKNTITFNTSEKGSDYFVKKDTDQWHQGAALPSTTVTPGKTYTWSFDMKCDRVISTQFDPNCTASNYTGNDAAMESSKSSTSTYDTPGEWKRVYLTVTVKADATSPYLHHSFCPRIAGVDLKVYVRRPLLEEKDHNTPYVKDSRNIGICDSSGLRNHASTEITNSPTWSTDSIMGNYCISNINGSNNYLKMLNNVTPTEELTISFWLKINDNTGGSWTSIYGGPRDGSSTHKGGISIHMNPENKLFVKFYGTSSKVDMTSTALNTTQWNHVVITHRYNNHCIYINGSKVSNSTDIGPIDWTNVSTIYIGRAIDTYTSRKISIDDFRIYATEFNDDDVKELYQTKGSLSKNGKMFVNEINENIRSLVDIEDTSLWALSNVTLTYSKDINRGILKLGNTAATSGTFRIAFPLDSLTAYINKSLTLSFNYKIITGTSFSMSDWCDGTITKHDSYGTMRGQGSRSSYNDIYRFMDFNIGANTEVEIWNLKLESKTLPEYKTGVDKKGILDTQEIIELDCSSMKVKTELGATWVRLFYHNNQSGTVFFSNNKQEFLKCRDVNKISDLWALEMFRGRDGKFELLLQYQSGGSSYNRWKQSSNFTRETIKGYEAVQVSWTGNYWGGLEYTNGSSSWVDGSVNHGNWYYAIGAKGVYMGGIPSWNGAETGWVELWVRCEDPEIMKMLKNGNCRATEFIEI